MGNNLLTRLSRKTLPFLVGVISSIYACDGKPTEPAKIPTASFTVNPSEGYVPLTACFDGSSSKPSGAPITRFIWQLEPGVTDQNSGARVCHTYMNPGNYNAGLIVEDGDGERSSQKLEQIVARDGNPVISMSNLSGIEDKVSSLDLTGKVISPIYPLANLTVTATSPELNVTINGPNMSYTNKTKDFNGATYIDLTAKDPDGRQPNSRIPVVVTPQTDVRGYTEHVLTGQRLSGIPAKYGTNAVQVNANGDFEFQASSNDSLRVTLPPMTPADSANFQDVLGVRFFNGKYYNLSLPIIANGQDVNLGNVQLIPRAKDIITGEDLLGFMQTYMLPGRWDDADMPIKVFIDNNPPSAEYREAVRQGIMERWQPSVNQWLPEGRKLNLAVIVPTEPAVGIRVDYTSTGQADFGFIDTFKKGIIRMNPIQLGDARIRVITHELGHGLGSNHVPYSNMIMYGTAPVAPANFEGLVTATKYKLKNGDVKNHKN